MKRKLNLSKFMKSPLRYPGGKTKTTDILLKHVPNFDEYREPFVGGGSMFCALKEMYPKKKFWINDLYKELYWFYKECRYHPNDVINAIRTLKYENIDGKYLFSMARERLEAKDVPLFMKAAYFFIINRTSFSGTTLSGGFSQLAYDKRFTESSINRLEDFVRILKPRLRITNYSYERVISKEGKNVFIYLDPPYAIENESLYGKNGDLHKNFDHVKFADDLKKCEHKWLITYNDCEYIRNLFSFADIIPFEATYGMKNVNKENINQKGNKEIIIKNF